MKVLSLFDGMACGMLAMKSAGVEIEKYTAFEIDKYATETACHNFPIIEERGDVFKADFTEFKGVDFLIGGSPCTYWSIAQTKNRETVASGMGSNTGLYAIPAEPLPVMKYELESVNNTDAGIVGILDMKGQDIIRRVYGPNGKAPTLTTCQGGNREPKIIEPTENKNQSCPVYEVKNGYITVKGKSYPIKLADGFYIIRKLTVTECKRLQTVPEWYDFPVSNSQAYKMLGNGWTVEVIAHLIRGLVEGRIGKNLVIDNDGHEQYCFDFEANA